MFVTVGEGGWVPWVGEVGLHDATAVGRLLRGSEVICLVCLVMVWAFVFWVLLCVINQSLSLSVSLPDTNLLFLWVFLPPLFTSLSSLSLFLLFLPSHFPLSPSPSLLLLRHRPIYQTLFPLTASSHNVSDKSIRFIVSFSSEVPIFS